MKKRFLSTLLMGALVVASTSMITSCKDYDDDIDDLQAQIDKAAMSSDLESLKTQVEDAAKTASDASTTAKDAADAAATNAGKLTEMQNAIDGINSNVTAVTKTANEALALANAAQTKEDAQAAIEALEKSIADGDSTSLAEIAKTNQAVAEAKAAAEAAQKAAETANTAAGVAQSTAENALAIAQAAQKAIDELPSTSTSAEVNAAIAKAVKEATEAINKEVAETYATKTSLAETDSKLTALATRVATIESQYVTATGLKSQLDALENELNKAITEANNAQDEANKAKFDEIEKTIENYKATVNQLFSAVTGVELFATYSGNGSIFQSNLKDGTPIALEMMHGLVGQDSKFGDDEAYKESDPIISFVKGSDIATDGGVVVRVNPVNADLTSAKIVLINSKGETLDFVEAGTPEKYDELITYTRSSSLETGLWKIPFTVKAGEGITEEAFKEAVDSDGNAILYAVAINNTDDAEDRYATSTWDIAPEYKAYAPASTFDFKVDNTFAEDIHNRWDGSETKTEDAVKEDASIVEYKWKNSTTQYPTPATAMDEDHNVVPAGTTVDDDARYDLAPLAVEVGKEFVLQIADQENADPALADKIQYYYVTLDKKCAIESEPSEWNAWNGYEYEGLFKTVKASEKIALKINSEEADGDIIGFRVYAVNYDGTLADPDGRSFYVQVGEAAYTDNVEGNDTINTVKVGFTGSTYMTPLLDNLTQNEVTIPLTKEFQSCTNNTNGIMELSESTKGNLATNNHVFYTLLKEDMTAATDWKDAKYIRLIVNIGANWKDGTSLQGVIKGYNGDGSSSQAVRVLNTLYVKINKVLPTSDNTVLYFLPTQGNQETGEFTLFMVPENGWNATTVSDRGAVDLDNVFYNLPENVVFKFDNAAYESDGETLTSNSSETTTADFGVSPSIVKASEKVIIENAKFIDSSTKHNVTAAINYGHISSEKDGDWTVDLNQKLTATFACWESKNSYAWGNNKQPKLEYNAAGTYTPTDLSTAIVVKNTYDDDRFSGDFKNLFITNKYLNLTDATNLTWGNPVQENPYVKPTIETTTGKVTWSNTQNEQTVTADHNEMLNIHVIDCFGHERTISLPVTILKPKK